MIHVIRSVSKIRHYYRRSSGLQKGLITLEICFSVSFIYIIVLKDKSVSHVFRI
jgi:hypothetical protein